MEAKNGNVERVVDTDEIIINKNPDGTFDGGYIGKQMYRLEDKLVESDYDEEYQWDVNFKPDAKIYTKYRNVSSKDKTTRIGIAIANEDGRESFYRHERWDEFVGDDGTVLIPAKFAYYVDDPNIGWDGNEFMIGYVKVTDSKNYEFRSNQYNKIPYLKFLEREKN